MKKLSDYLKHHIIGYFRLKRQFPIAVTELMSKDIVVGKISNGISPLIEIETKISFSDFKADFHKEKHLHPENLHVDQFYFGVVPSIADKCNAYLESIKSPYGLISLGGKKYQDKNLMDEMNLWDNFCVFRTAKKLPNPHPIEPHLIFSRMSSELFRLENQYLFNYGRFDNDSEKSIQK